MKKTAIIHALAASILLLPAAAMGASILVNTADDEFNNDGDCSLREAVHSANTNPVSGVDACNGGNTGADTITILVNGTIQLTSQIEVTEAVSIVGLGMDATFIDGGEQTRHFIVDMPDNTHDFSLASLTLERGRSDEDNNGPGGIRGGGSLRLLQVGTVDIESVRFRDNQAVTSTKLDVRGGAILSLLPDNNGSRLEIIDSIFENNTSQYIGGAVSIPPAGLNPTTEALQIERSRFSGNTAGGLGGAISASVEGYAILDSTFEGNTTSSDFCCAFGGAAALSSEPGSLNLIERTTFIDSDSRDEGGALILSKGFHIISNSTLHGNRSQAGGGQAIELRNEASAVLFFSTLHDNGRGLATDEAIRVCSDCSLSLDHSIVWANWEPSIDCRTLGGSITSNGHNIDSSGTCTSESSDQPMTDPRLFAPGDYGDSVPGLVLITLPPKPGSPAIDGGASSCPAAFGGTTSEDQRGEFRPVTGPRGSPSLCDIGAVEYQPGSDPVPDEIFADRFENNP